MKISYTYEPSADYRKATDSAQNPDELVIALLEFLEIAYDAYEVAKEIRLSDWSEFKKGLAKERSGEYAGDEWDERYGAILLPMVMLKVSMTAGRFNVPWGIAFIRMIETGLLIKQKGHYVVVENGVVEDGML